ncbi:2-aminoethylphosphonate--pyruvate transaminase [Pandoraea pnomenusa]|jgi:2-aminoethylphosphonate-pyruvate transaminase|uniref:2-aminoethylphosphonate--pyruvate transaminase n=1 Tax=Pandoraea pnomenusa TaxID=93220 RepID=UPI0003C73F60|nr:2-aminoethylphosphonate--pyruvate transaminase [Pandoraea pnomenusa]AHB07484.1 2-aminoethylphosphonate--pyruvate aminotransferase [Pandoraea pnomenusa 3kgm]AHN75354.1 2-aminoethylphosphonate--pyruvate transaminase [Pandoraea pnomenusa]ANC45207.1 2-aminoethylphosphonate--pyruvate transaminase [Pandoraea pnomenusa]MBN9093409.1 2-aminoethylphosphonate--pyruvate transaminase [Pandoraea pnomenusa]QDH58312.1 2-aminoethylphosphonate--pyruvate transaminase [Pandoraea pnomenusa]
MILGQEPILLTPGPLTTSPATRQAMLRDWGSWDAQFNRITASLCRDLVDVVHGGDDYVCVPLQGSGTFSVEAAIGTLTPRGARILVPDNGAYCQRILKICRYLGRDAIALPIPEDAAASAAAIDDALTRDPSITHVAQVHLETGAGVLNPLADIARVCEKHGRGLIVDAMSSFGAVEIDARSMPFDALVAASGKCLEGVPGMGFVIAKRSVLEASAGNSHSLAMDLHDQYVYMRKTTQWRFTPPTHVVAALRAAVDQFLAEGGQPVRGERYRKNCRTLVEGMATLGFRPFLAPEVQAPVIVTFHAPADSKYDFKAFYAAVRERGYILYPGKLTQLETFRVGCIGAIDENEMRNVVTAIAQSLASLGIRQVAPLTRAA